MAEIKAQPMIPHQVGIGGAEAISEGRVAAAEADAGRADEGGVEIDDDEVVDEVEDAHYDEVGGAEDEAAFLRSRLRERPCRSRRSRRW